MKRFFSILFQLLAICGFITGLYYLYKKYFVNDASLDEVYDDEFDDFDFDDEDFTETVSDSREYVTLNSSESKTIPSDDDFDEICD